RINCAVCQDFNLCVTCFTSGEELEKHKSWHDYRVLEQYSFPLFNEDWGADEEELLIEGAEMHGLGNWADIAEFIGNRTKEDCEQHYMKTYVNSETWPLPDMNVKFQIDEETMRERKRRRLQTIENRTQNTTQKTPTKVLTYDYKTLPANHEIAGYMPHRYEFETEYENDAELVIKDLELNEHDDPQDFEMKTYVLEIYNKKLNKRAERKRLIFEHGLLEFRKNKAIEDEKYKSKEEKELLSKIKPFAQSLCKKDFDDLRDELFEELSTRLEIRKLKEYRQMGIMTLSEATKYEKAKAQKEANRELAARPYNGHTIPISYSDRLAVKYISSKMNEHHSPSSPYGNKTLPAAASPVIRLNVRKQPQALDLNDEEGVHLLSEAERRLCETLRIFPKSYLVIKETILKEWARSGGTLRRRQARGLIRIDVNKTARIYDFFIEMGWIRQLSENTSNN
ncbi:24783_t:CDS:10, partial [Cetraspora pellucida]